MKRLKLILTVVGALALFTTTGANASDDYYGHGYVGRGSYAHGYIDYARGYGPRYVDPGYEREFVGYVNSHHGHVRHGHGYGNVHRGYAKHGYGGHGYPVYSHASGISISTPHFGLRIGH